MSNILDAIRKAEADRHDDAVPSLEAIVQKRRSGSSKPRPRLGWLIWVALVLVIGSAGYLYKDSLLNRGGVLANKVSVKFRVLAGKLGAGQVFDRSHATEAVLPRSASPSPVARGTTGSGLTARQKQLLDSLQFEVVSYSRDSSKRFAMIDGRTYREGDQLEGFRITNIVTEGVLVDVAGEKVLIRP